MINCSLSSLAVKEIKRTLTASCPNIHVHVNLPKSLSRICRWILCGKILVLSLMSLYGHSFFLIPGFCGSNQLSGIAVYEWFWVCRHPWTHCARPAASNHQRHFQGSFGGMDPRLYLCNLQTRSRGSKSPRWHWPKASSLHSKNSDRLIHSIGLLLYHHLLVFDGFRRAAILNNGQAMTRKRSWR